MQTAFPLVSVICLCYNHKRFLAEALDSVLAQTYSNIEIIIADDASTDASQAIIKAYLAQYPQLIYLPNNYNVGHCQTFNRALARASGKYVIDFATDDMLLPDRITEQVQQFEQLDDSYGVLYADAELIDEHSRHIGYFYRRLPDGKQQPTPHAGYIYEQILKRYFIPAPTMMMKRSLLIKLGGYDEQLAYEDFDFWVRSAKVCQYYFQDKVQTKRRLHARQKSKQVYLPRDKQLASTVKVCYKAYALNTTPSENDALGSRIKYELKHAYLSGNFAEALQLILLLEKMNGLTFFYRLLKRLASYRCGIPRPVYQLFIQLKRR